MFIKQCTMVSMLLLLCASCLNIREDASQKAERILRESLDKLSSTSHKKTIFLNTQREARQIVIYTKIKHDGTTNSRSEQFLLNPKDSLSTPMSIITIKNKDGNFVIIGDTVVELLFEMKNTGDILKPEFRYSLSNGLYKNIPCYIITQKTTFDNDSYDEYISLHPHLVKKLAPEQLKLLAERIFAAKIINYIDMDSGVIYEASGYNANGEKINSSEYELIDSSTELSDELFKIPENCSVVKANTMEDLSKITRKLNLGVNNLGVKL